jgi:NAD(P)-dependent dehydrogenase (short-subunit alcohol dehydrogenase family)
MPVWTAADLPDLSGRTVLVTGANSGIGFEAARMIAARGAATVLASRNPEKAAAAESRILAAHPDARVELLSLDLADLSSVRRAAATFATRHDRLDVLINNAGVMMLPRCETADGFEMLLGTNHLGHFALTGLLGGALAKGPGARIVTVASSGHRFGRIAFDDLQLERSYSRLRAYGQSKLANLLFTYELQRRIQRAGLQMAAMACHPGAADTNLVFVEPSHERASWRDRLARRLPFLAQSTQMGALPTLYAAFSPDAVAGAYYGPRGLFGWRGYPKRVGSSRRSHDEQVAARLWDVSEALTGVVYEWLG